jgi:hypothetical protein
MCYFFSIMLNGFGEHFGRNGRCLDDVARSAERFRFLDIGFLALIRKHDDFRRSGELLFADGLEHARSRPCPA